MPGAHSLMPAYLNRDASSWVEVDARKPGSCRLLRCRLGEPLTGLWPLMLPRSSAPADAAAAEVAAAALLLAAC